MDNTVAQVCTGLFTLLDAVSTAMASFSEEPSAFVTEVVALDGRPCVENACPQCNAARRLLASGVSLVTVSTSTTPFNVSSTTPVAPSQLTTALRSTLQNTTLQPRAVGLSLVEIYRPIFPALISEDAMHNLWEHHGELLFLMLGFASVGLLLVLTVYRFFRRKTREVLVRCGLFAGVRLAPPRGPYDRSI